MKKCLAGCCLLMSLCVASSCTIKNNQWTDKVETTEESAFSGVHIVPEYARGFELSYRSGYVLLDIQDPQNEESTTFHYALVRRGTKPAGIPGSYTVIETPIRSVICMTSLQLSNFIEMGELDKVVGVTSTRHLFNREMNERLKSGKTAKIGIEGNFDNEVIMSMNPDLILVSPFKRGGYETLKDVGIPLIPHLGYKEMTPLGQAEWVKFVGLLVGQEQKANEIFDAIAARYNELKELTAEENLPGILKRLSFKSLDDMYAAIGYGGVTSLKLIGRLREDIQRILHQHQAERQAEVPVEGQPEVTRPAVPVREHSEQGIVVQGLSNCLVKFSKCCSPVPGDEIVGFITRGYGVSVHRKDCPNADPARRPPEEAGRWIKVSWGGKTRESYRTNLQVVSKDRPNLLVDISTILSAAKVQVSSLNARSTADGFALISLAVDVSDSQQLQAVMRRLEQISGVMRVTRPAG